MIERILESMKTPDPVQLDLSALAKGVNNHHIDIRLSPRFCDLTHQLITRLIRQKASSNHVQGNLGSLNDAVQSAYLDMMKVLIHRVNTDLEPVEVAFLQFSVPKYILQTTRQLLDTHITQTKQRSQELQSTGSAHALNTHQQLAWLGTHYSAILYDINKHLFNLLHRAEQRELTRVRQQYLSHDYSQLRHILFNPLLLTRDPSAPGFLLDQYYVWDLGQDDKLYLNVTRQLEAMFKEFLPELDTQALMQQQGKEQPEIYDELGGLLSTRPFLGPANDTRQHIHEAFTWLDSGDNLSLLFDDEHWQEVAGSIRREQGHKAWKEFRQTLKRLEKLRKRCLKLLLKTRQIELYLASEKARTFLRNKVTSQLKVEHLVQYLSHQISLSQLQDRSIGNIKLSDEDIRTLKQQQKNLQSELPLQSQKVMESALSKMAQFRLHLKYHRFAHRCFNRLRVLDDPNELQLSKSSGTLYQLPLESEIETDGDRVIHHSILKADVRGSTTVIDELDRKQLNAASFFSLRFFNPINEVLAAYGAHKVFIEGDAIILSFLEYQQNPQQWYSVAHACGLARTLLRIVHSNNLHSRQLQLPPLELGIGICYAGESPRYLYDQDRPIMISSAIGLADRLSSCSWQLRKLLDPSPFNVEVLEIEHKQREWAEKGQQHLRYNVNGILLEDSAFAKLQDEISLTRTTLPINDRQVNFYHGKYPDMNGRVRELLIREAQVGLWKDNKIHPGPGNRAFYEVVTSSHVMTLVQHQLQEEH